MQHLNNISTLVDHLFRHESGKMVAVLTRQFGLPNMEQAEDIVHDTMLAALETWKFGELPPNPQAWLYRTAKNKAIDLVRHQQVQHKAAMSLLLTSEYSLEPAMNEMFTEHEIQDSMLRMMYACCHPALQAETQIALVLKTLCGLGTREIANAFLATEDTIQKRIYRAKERLRQENVSLEYPGSDAILLRTEVVLKTLYLLFNEGYYSSHPEMFIREELCEEAIRLCLILSEQALPSQPQTYALLALMCYHVSRFGAKTNDQGFIILLKDQDRALWNKELIKKGDYFLNLSSNGLQVHDFHIEAAIASLHAHAPAYHETNWLAIMQLYQVLYERTQNPIVALNRAIVMGEIHGPKKAIAALEQISTLEKNCFYQTALGELHLKDNNMEKAKEHLVFALKLTNSSGEKELIKRKMDRLL